MQSYRHLISRWLGHQQPVIAFFELQFRAILTRSLRSWILHTPHKESALQNLCCNVDYKTCSIATNYAFRSLLQLAKELVVFHRIMHATYPWITSNPYWWSCVQYSNLHGAEVSDGNMSLIMPFGVFHLLTSDGTMTYDMTYYACAPKQISSQMPRHRCWIVSTASPMKKPWSAVTHL